jgi:hypothetical protein
MISRTPEARSTTSVGESVVVHHFINDTSFEKISAPATTRICWVLASITLTSRHSIYRTLRWGSPAGRAITVAHDADGVETSAIFPAPASFSSDRF